MREVTLIKSIGPSPGKWRKIVEIRPHRRCKGRDHPDGISQLRFRFTWGGGAFIWKKPPVFDRL